MQAQQYWNDIGSKKEFEDPLYAEKLKPYLYPSSKILEYGCGYGRMMRILSEFGYENLVGYDFAPNMIERGKKENPHLDLRLLEESGKIPEKDASFDGVIMATVLCCMIDLKEQRKVIDEVGRILKDGGVLYITDFMICDDPIYANKYAGGLEEFGIKGVYTTSENLTVRHHMTKTLMPLLEKFDIHWFEQSNFKTMNQNPARTFHCIATK